jgi:hypothetical protein
MSWPDIFWRRLHHLAWVVGAFSVSAFTADAAINPTTHHRLLLKPLVMR